MNRKILGLFFCFVLIGCGAQSTKGITSKIQILYQSTIDGGGMNAVEISAYCKQTKRLFTASSKYKGVLVYDISDLKNPKKITTIDISPYGGNVNSVAIENGNVAMAIENSDRQANGVIVVFDTKNLQEVNTYIAGALPDMVAYSPDGNYIISANEGEPNTDYTADPKGSITIVDKEANEVTTLDFEAFNSSTNDLKKLGLRNSGKNATF
jgi:DNA-binding beta-propeller fold protein YncE